MSETAETLAAREPSVKYVALAEPALVRGFELLATAPGGVAGLRQAILSLAVRGKLTAQSDSDEPAGKLLNRASEPAVGPHEVVTGKRFRPAAPLEDHELPFDLPRNWAWARLPPVTHDWGQKQPEARFTYDACMLTPKLACPRSVHFVAEFQRR